MPLHDYKVKWMLCERPSDRPVNGSSTTEIIPLHHRLQLTHQIRCFCFRHISIECCASQLKEEEFWLREEFLLHFRWGFERIYTEPKGLRWANMLFGRLLERFAEGKTLLKLLNKIKGKLGATKFKFFENFTKKFCCFFKFFTLINRFQCSAHFVYTLFFSKTIENVSFDAKTKKIFQKNMAAFVTFLLFLSWNLKFDRAQNWLRSS